MNATPDFSKLVGIPWSRARCVEIAELAYREMGLQFPQPSHVLDYVEWHKSWRRIDGPRYGALVEMQFPSMPHPHVGVIIDEPPRSILHARVDLNSAIQSIGAMRRWITGYYVPVPGTAGEVTK